MTDEKEPLMSTLSTRITTLGETSLTGWRGAAGRAAARPIARVTPFSRRQVEVAIGLALVAYAVYRVVAPIVRTSRET